MKPTKFASQSKELAASRDDLEAMRKLMVANKFSQVFLAPANNISYAACCAKLFYKRLNNKVISDENLTNDETPAPLLGRLYASDAGRAESAGPKPAGNESAGCASAASPRASPARAKRARKTSTAAAKAR